MTSARPIYTTSLVKQNDMVMLALFVLILTIVGAVLLWVLIFQPIKRLSHHGDANPTVKVEGKP